MSFEDRTRSVTSARCLGLSLWNAVLRAYGSLASSNFFFILHTNSYILSSFFDINKNIIALERSIKILDYYTHHS